MDFYLVAFTQNLYCKLFFNNTSDYESKNDGEIILREKLDSFSNEFKLIKRLPRTLYIIGQRGLIIYLDINKIDGGRGCSDIRRIQLS